MESETFEKTLGPFYTTIRRPAPSFAYHLYDRLVAAGNVDGKEFTQEQKDQLLTEFPCEQTIDLPEGKSYTIPRHSRLVEITTTDPKCALMRDSSTYESAILGAGTFAFITELFPYTLLQIQHQGPFHVKFYN